MLLFRLSSQEFIQYKYLALEYRCSYTSNVPVYEHAVSDTATTKMVRHIYFHDHKDEHTSRQFESKISIQSPVPLVCAAPSLYSKDLSRYIIEATNSCKSLRLVALLLSHHEYKDLHCSMCVYGPL